MGRPRKFVADAALSAAVDVFWEKGFEGATLTDLTTAMRITRPSLYAAFGNKQQLFLRVLELYRSTYMAFVRKALEEPTACIVVESLLNGYVNNVSGGTHPPGCLEINCLLACSDEGGLIRQELAALRAADEAALRRRLDRALAEDDLPTETNPTDLACYIMVVVQGMSVRAAAGADRETLYSIVRTALWAWPARPVDGQVARPEYIDAGGI